VGGFFKLAELLWVWMKFGQERRLELLGIVEKWVFLGFLVVDYTDFWFKNGGWGLCL